MWKVLQHQKQQTSIKTQWNSHILVSKDIVITKYDKEVGSAYPFYEVSVLLKRSWHNKFLGKQSIGTIKKKEVKNIKKFYLTGSAPKKAPPWTQVLNWTFIRVSGDVPDVFWTPYVRSICVLCPGGSWKHKAVIWWCNRTSVETRCIKFRYRDIWKSHTFCETIPSIYYQ